MSKSTIKTISKNDINFLKINNTVPNNQVFNDSQTIQSIKGDTIAFGENAKSKDVPVGKINAVLIANTKKTTNEHNDILDFIKSTAATNAVTSIKIASGVYDVTEHIGDGILWTGGKIVEGSSFVIAQIAGLFDEKSKQSILDWREDAKDWTKDTIAVNYVDEAENAIFNTEFGKAINDASYMKHDSKLANTIEDITKVGAEIAVATAATIATGGAASPTLIAVVGGLGFAEGTGEQAQKTYQKSTNTTGAQEAGIFFSGLERATRWYAYGRLGTGVISSINQARGIATHGEWTTRLGASDNIGDALKNVWNTRRKRGRGFIENIPRYLKEAVTEFDDLADMSNGIFGTVADALNNQDMSAGETGGKIVVGLIQNIFINTLIKRPAHLANSIRGLQEFTNIDSLDKRVTSLIKTILKTADAAEDSGVIPIDAYDIGKNIAENIEERSD